MSNKIMTVFTASYPFGKRETYFENELVFLSKAFDKVYIVPIYNPTKSGIRRVVPENVIVIEPILKQGIGRFIEGIGCFKYNSLWISDFFSGKVYKSIFRFKKWINSWMLYSKGLSVLIKMDLPKNSYLYSYWAEIPFFVSDEISSFKRIVRMHGGDFYLNRNNGYLPLRSKIYQTADLLLPISKDIQETLLNHYEISKSKIFLSYLGVFNNVGTCSIQTMDKKIRFVSCSNVYGLKRVHLIYDVLLAMNENIQIEWHHFGDGDLMGNLKEYINERIQPNITFVLYGHLNQKQIEEMYENNYYDWFINTSQYEGLPVSIMESFSYGIPAIATNVGGTSEIVNDQNGFLINTEIGLRELVEKLENIERSDYFNKRIKAYETWLNKFEAKQNYEKMTNRFFEIN
ncbi:glycosyltransferase [Flavobacterium sp. LAR06]|uniref:glycosyltransferase n=1 Tax=Flavobacterium sp. LAR06 TaxID=3064897 RepID=UPI0035BED8B4